MVRKALCRYFDDEVEEAGKKCFRCGQRGHIQSECQNQPKRQPCALCAQFGHNKAQCPSCTLFLFLICSGAGMLLLYLHVLLFARSYSLVPTPQKHVHSDHLQNSMAIVPEFQLLKPYMIFEQSDCCCSCIWWCAVACAHVAAAIIAERLCRQHSHAVYWSL